ncbi:LacI family DNA-binding transcriptional regulator [Olivibacter ginsenosidimutans]|uniref:LacI family DNA-binding transcriptional regulator n=1 Tax=Olivibacter ginsenosidimutans TaxID=1176537 RepID=A0ABP9B9M6_9SPHI
MKRNRISIKDISKALGLSNTTISFILNGKAEEMRISAQVAEKVLAYVKEVGYTPNYLARGLVTGKTNTIGFIVESIGNPFFSQIASLIEEQAYNSGYKIIYSSTNGKQEKALELIRMFRDRGVDGYIICPTDGLAEEIKQLREENRSIVLFDRYLPSVVAHYIGIDNERAMYEACKHLADGGKKNIAMVTTDSEQTQMISRLAGYQRLLKETGLQSHVLQVPYDDIKQRLQPDFESFIKNNPTIDAICFATNYLAIGSLEIMRNLHISIPDQISVVAFDDNEVLRLFQPGITAVEQPLEEMAKLIIDRLLLDLKLGKVTEKTVHKELPARLIIRASSL